MSTTTVQSLSNHDLDLFRSFRGLGHPEVGVPMDRFDDLIAKRSIRPEWCFVATSGGRVRARAAFAGSPQAERPFTLLFLDLSAESDRHQIGADLLRSAYAELSTRYGDLTTARGDRPAYDLFLPVGWRDRPEVNAQVQDRIGCAEAAGMALFAERFTLEWMPEVPLPPKPIRLHFTPAVDDTLVLELFTRIDRNTLDAHARLDLSRHGSTGAARERFSGLVGEPSPREWWRFGHDDAGQLVGIVVPTSIDDGATGEISYIGVADEHRGHRYSLDLIAEGTRILAEAGAGRVYLQTDAHNAPMVNAFRDSGFRQKSALLIYV